MPIHDWSNVADGLYHDFLHGWTVYLSRTINDRLDQERYYAMFERDLEAVLDAKAGLYSEADAYIVLRPSIVVRLCTDHSPVARLEIVSPGLKRSSDHWQEFINNLETSVRNGIHVLLVDLHPPVALDSDGMPQRLSPGHSPASWVSSDPVSVSYRAGNPPHWAVSASAIGAELQPMPLHLTAEESIEVPLEETYQKAWCGMAGVVREQVIYCSQR